MDAAETDQMQRRAWFSFPDFGGSMRHMEADSDEFSIGREAGNDLLLPGPFVSKHHARVCRVGSGFVVEDLDSKNGICVNDIPISGAVAHSLASHDVITIGPYTITFWTEDGAEQTESFLHDGGERRSGPQKPSEFALFIDPVTKGLWLDGRPTTIQLSPKERALAELLASVYGRAFSNAEIWDGIWGPEHDGELPRDDGQVHKLVHLLRRKIGEDPSVPKYILNTPGTGYRLSTQR